MASRATWLFAPLMVAVFWGRIALSEAPVDPQFYPALFDVAGVAKGDVLNIRQAANATSTIMGDLAPDARGIEVIGVQDGWGRINLAESAGFVRMNYLVAQTGPGCDSLTAPLSCFGTEPFWSMNLTPESGKANLSTPDGESQLALGQVWPGSGLQQPVAVDLDLGLLVLTPAACGDGMSDRVFGISAAVFPTAAGQASLHGCCSIAP